jgi:hypothetical protein
MMATDPHSRDVHTRRDVLIGGAACAAATMSGAGAWAQTSTVARGRVVEQGVGKGIEGVMVSNGEAIVRTDAEGRYAIAVGPGQSILVIKPSGFALPVEPSTMLPRFAHVHCPEGTPADLRFRFPGIAPTRALPDAIDFTLARVEEKPAFNAILFTDPQPESLVEVDYIRDDVVANVEGIDATFGITTGDVMFDDLSYYSRYNGIVGTIGLPWFNCPGNHDMNLEAPDDTSSRDTFIRTFGARDLAFQVGETTFFALDNVEYLGTDPAKPNGFGKYRGFFRDRQLTFIRNVLSNVPKSQLVVFFFHIPLRTLLGTDPGVSVVNTRAFLEAISTHSNTLSFSGHTHTSEHWYFGQNEGYAAGTHHHQVLAAVSGSWWSGPMDERGIPVALQTDGAPNGFHILSIDGARYTTTLVPARDPSRAQIRLVLDSQLHRDGAEVMRDYRSGALLTGPVLQAALPSTRLVANFFTGGPRSTLEMAVGRGSFAPMTRVERVDPFVTEVYARNEATKKPWVKPARSTHVWQATLPADLMRGSHRVRVRATDEYGRLHIAGMVLEVV